MAEKPEIFLEIGAGYFRIPTAEVNYNITMIGESSPATTGRPSLPAGEHQALAAAGAEGSSGDDYYQLVSEDLYHDIGQLAKSLSSTIMEIPAEDRRQQRVTLDEDGENLESAKTQLKDIVAMTERAAMEIMDNVEKVQGGTGAVQTLLSQLKNHPAFGLNSMAENDAAGEESPLASEVEVVTADINRALDLLAAIKEGGQPVAPATPSGTAEKKQRYLFDLDIIFQTLYELCTNETVKEHISGAREKAGEIFDLPLFQDALSAKLAGQEADEDNYFNVPMSDVFQSLFAACSDKSIKNLLKKMDSGQATIFLDQTIPLEAPDLEEVEDLSSEVTEETESAAATDPRLDEVIASLQKSQETLSGLPKLASQGAAAAAAGSAMTLADQRDIFAKIESAFGVSTSITADVSKITEALSFQDLSGQQIMKILKMLSDFQVQLLAIVVSFGSQLKMKKNQADITIEESKSLAQHDVDKYLSSISAEGKEDDGMLDQSTVNEMLEEFGF
ncbi:MAG: protein phosphatase CheZ [Deltaproteobacteria bacterium]|nr:protein phosphatase CheZ [Deltaproteobacteria bacterium]